MAICDVCGNDYDKAFTVTQGSRTGTFDAFECAIHAMAPTCSHCGCKIVGHGMEKDGTFFCCAHCAERAGVRGMEDRR
jgi:Rieske Fe-S protein